jgi:hypothetical protein
MKNLGLAILSLVFLIACESNDPTPQLSTLDFDHIMALPQESLNLAERQSLSLMREEEKLARDVYQALCSIWNVEIFNNIAQSEQTHTDAVKTLLIKYNLTDPVSQVTVGIFENQDLQLLYNELVSKGNISLANAYNVGATIEDLDIFDLENALLEIDNRDITLVYNNLTKGSRNHMRSFYGKITEIGGQYQAQFITQQKLESIIDSSKETGS